MKILFVHERFGSLAGAEANLSITATEMKRRGHSVFILHGEGTGKAEAQWEELFAGRISLKERDPKAATKRAIEQFAPDVIYVHKMADLEVIQCLVESGLPLIRMVHDHDIYCMRSYKYRYFSREICTLAAGPHCVYSCGAFVTRNHGPGFPLKYVSYAAKKREIALNHKFHRMVVVTNYMRDELLRNDFTASRIEIHAPVPRMGDPALRSSFGDRNLIIYAGQIIRGKGVDILLESLALVTEPFECIILGDGSHRPYCEALNRKLGLEGKVRFAGFVPQEELKTYYRESTLVAISSVWPEPFATIGVEVLRYAIPVVAFDAGGIKDWLVDGFNGYLVPWMDRKTYARRVSELLRDKTLARRLGEQGRERVNDQYDFDRYIGNLETMFDQVRQEVACARPKDCSQGTALSS